MAEINVTAGQSAQVALDKAVGGDVINLEAGAVFPQTLVLPVKDSAQHVTIQSSRAAELPPNVRVSPADAPKMPSVCAAANATHALETRPGSHHYKLIGVEFRPAAENLFLYDLLWLGSMGAEQNTLAQVPHHVTLDRCYVHAYGAAQLKRGIALNTAETTIINCYLSGFKVVGQEAQAILGWNGPGPFHLINNYIEGAGENLMFGGSDPSIPNLVPSDIEIRRNTFSKPLSWRVGDPAYAGQHWTVKNIFELKNARRVIVDGNIFEHCWGDAQDGTAIQLTPRNQETTAPWSCVEDVAFTNNIIRGAGAGVSMLGTDNLQPSGLLQRIRIANNLFLDISPAWGGNGALYNANGGVDITWEHNTSLHRGNVMTLNTPHTRLVYRNNIVRHNDYGVFGTGRSIGQDSLDFYAPGAVFANNLLVGPPNYPQFYPSGALFAESEAAVGFNADYSLSAGSPYKGKASDGKDLGCDVAALLAAQGGTGPPPPVPPTPTPVPTPPPGAPIGSTRKVAWPSTGEAKQNAILATQAQDGYYAQKHLTGAYMQFVKVK